MKKMAQTNRFKNAHHRKDKKTLVSSGETENRHQHQNRKEKAASRDGKSKAPNNSGNNAKGGELNAKKNKAVVAKPRLPRRSNGIERGKTY